MIECEFADVFCIETLFIIREIVSAGRAGDNFGNVLDYICLVGHVVWQKCHGCFFDDVWRNRIVWRVIFGIRPVLFAFSFSCVRSKHFISILLVSTIAYYIFRNVFDSVFDKRGAAHE